MPAIDLVHALAATSRAVAKSRPVLPGFESAPKTCVTAIVPPK
jgi:hypothetical protein